MQLAEPGWLTMPASQGMQFSDTFTAKVPSGQMRQWSVSLQ